MHLSREQAGRVKKAIKQFNETSELAIYEPCDCGDRIRHDYGGNYHECIYLSRDSEQVFVKHETTCKFVPGAEWEICDDWKTVIKQNLDWL